MLETPYHIRDGALLDAHAAYRAGTKLEKKDARVLLKARVPHQDGNVRIRIRLCLAFKNYTINSKFLLDELK